MRLRPLLLASVLLAAPALSPSQPSKEVVKLLPLAPDGRVTLDTYKGSLTVKVWDRQEVSIVARVESDGGDNDRESDKVERTRVEISSDENSVSIRTDYHDLDRHRSFFDWFDGDNGSLPNVHYTISMPATAQLRVKDYKSEGHVAGLKSNLEYETYKGELRLEDHAGAVDLETYKGEVRVRYSSFVGPSRFETYKGTIEVTLPPKSGVSVEADLGRRADFDSDLDLRRSSRRRHDDQYISGEWNGGGARLQFKSEKGNIRLRTI